MATRTPPQQNDPKYMLSNGNYDWDAYMRDWNAFQADLNRMLSQKSTSTAGSATNEGGHYDSTIGAWVPDNTVNGADLGQPSPPQPVGPDEPDTPGAPDENEGPEQQAKPKQPSPGNNDGERPWWETAADASATADPSRMIGGPNAGDMAPDWMGEIQNFRDADKARLMQDYKTGTPEDKFRSDLHNARQDRYETYAHGYDWADKDTPDNDIHSAANSIYIGDKSWLDELDQMTNQEQQDWLRDVQAADPESAQAVLDASRKRRGGK